MKLSAGAWWALVQRLQSYLQSTTLPITMQSIRWSKTIRKLICWGCVRQPTLATAGSDSLVNNSQHLVCTSNTYTQPTMHQDLSSGTSDTNPHRSLCYIL